MTKVTNYEQIGRLLAKYGPLLTFHQKQIMEQYFFYDLTMQEIADEQRISRSAVNDIIKQSSEKLHEFEERLALLAKEDTIIKLLDQLEGASKTELKNIIAQIKEHLTHGI